MMLRRSRTMQSLIVRVDCQHRNHGPCAFKRERLSAGTPNTMSYRVTVSISKQMSFISPYIARTFTPRASVATSSMEGMGLTGDDAFVPSSH